MTMRCRTVWPERVKPLQSNPGVDIAWAPMEGDVILFRLQGVRLCPACLILRPAGEMTEAGTCRSCAPAAGEASGGGTEAPPPASEAAGEICGHD